ncbi:SDR family oxidoreductase [Nocardia terpenica]|uniref:SDR family oxidoreductase n=1 Tax=Nocardia terpenica TaxID=455432 RepID=UPI001895AD95|nr:SDR family oxidoreductase [Nocardia terpenica]MBF6065897.1 SDR family oxidoreductase [Nocardia terpenica]MBF6108340.1 SDR family oxidoreductase [Nocardia terpenica]MBF6116012.1 SDR family oxidoreductase [Nocardia terpenica]MBF6123142.1 SDR family oxidoreductase [Nocardia terpenica]
MTGTGAVLLTGATGLVGAEVAARLLAAGREVVAVRHTTSRILRNDGTVLDGVHAVPGDIRRPGLGLTPGTGTAGNVMPDGVVDGHRVGVIVHSAATTAFDATDSEYEELNVQATAHAVELAQTWNVPLVYVSTAYVCGMQGGTIPEAALDGGSGFGNRYEDSKFRAEHLVRGAAGLRWVIVRPGIVTGATGTGRVRDFKNLYTVVKLIVEGKLRVLPGRYDATLALAPVDHVADVITTATLTIDTACGGTFHALGRGGLSLREVSDVLAEYPSFRVATFVPESTFTVEDLDPLQREYFLRIGALYTSYFQRRPVFATANADALLGRSSPATGKDYLRLVLDYCLESGYLGTPLPTVSDVLARYVQPPKGNGVAASRGTGGDRNLGGVL